VLEDQTDRFVLLGVHHREERTLVDMIGHFGERAARIPTLDPDDSKGGVCVLGSLGYRLFSNASDQSILRTELDDAVLPVNGRGSNGSPGATAQGTSRSGRASFEQGWVVVADSARVHEELLHVPRGGGIVECVDYIDRVLGDDVRCLILILLAKLTDIRSDLSVIGRTHVFDNLIKITKNLLKDDIRVRSHIGSCHNV
jgi:hypothetical protein